LDGIKVDDVESKVYAIFTPQKNTCHSLIYGLCIREKLTRMLPKRFHSKIFVTIAEGTYFLEETINRQLRDKEQCLVEMGKDSIRCMVDSCLEEATEPIQF
jgi:bisphosphoglycerate-dependent phosphoglycerate mutase